ncbi:MAG: hypothetical protein IPO43_10280 [Rhodoferax sp.]|nr:hypothetical protein [Rhodoferax sp.]
MTEQDQPTHTDDPSVQPDLFGDAKRTAASGSPPVRSPIERLQRSLVITAMLCLGALSLVLCLALPGLYFYDKHQGQVVTSVQAAGSVMTVELTSGWLIRSLVQTELGFFVLSPAISLDKGKPLTLEQRGNAERYLCDERHRCARVL